MSIQARQAGNLPILRQPAAAWEDFLLNRFSEFNSAQDLNLPLWGLDQGAYSLHWILTNPFNNRLTWERDPQGGLQLSLEHEFTQLEPEQPFTALLHLGGVA